MKAVFLVISLFMSIASAHSMMEQGNSMNKANFNGRWRGQGVMVSNNSGRKNCQLIAFDVQQTTTTIALLGGSMKCEQKLIPINSVNGSITPDGRITVWGMTIGRVNGSVLQIQTSLGKGGTKNLQLRVNGNMMSMYFDRVENGLRETVTANLTN